MLILVRPDTVPDDISMIFETDGLLTGKGGATSHAAVTAVRLGITSVVNCTSLEVFEEKKKCRLNDFHLKWVIKLRSMVTSEMCTRDTTRLKVNRTIPISGISIILLLLHT